MYYFVYALYNVKNDKIYIGQTKDMKERLALHNQKVFKGYTSRFDGEWKLVYEEEVLTRAEALKREEQLKSFRGREFVRSIIQLHP